MDVATGHRYLVTPAGTRALDGPRPITEGLDTPSASASDYSTNDKEHASGYSTNDKAGSTNDTDRDLPDQ